MHRENTETTCFIAVFAMQRSRVQLPSAPLVSWPARLFCDLPMLRSSAFLLAGLFLWLITSRLPAEGVGARSASERSSFVDDKTGVTVTRLTSSSAKDDKIYQTHPSWL